MNMKRLILVCFCGGIFPAEAMAADPHKEWLTMHSNRGTEIEIIRVASEKPLIATEETDVEVAGILEEVEALDEALSDCEDIDESS